MVMLEKKIDLENKMAKAPTSEDFEVKLADILADIPYTRKSSLASSISTYIQEAIIRGDIPGGYIFPGENEMCTLLDVGRSTLREAYSTLQTLGLITRTKNGTVVNKYENIDNLANLATIVDMSDMDELLQFREVIEVAVVRSAAQKCTEEDIQKLRNILAQQEAASDSPSKLMEIDYRFHSTMAEISGNKLFLISLNSVRPKFKENARWVFTKQQKRTTKEHSAIVDALESHDSKAAEKAMRYHLKSIMQTAHENSDQAVSVS
jgi:GntR family transcriptional repressor for pyruvate dehydrogenase complex